MKNPLLGEETLGDEIIAEVRTIRDALASKFNYDLDLLFDEAKRRKKFRGSKEWQTSPKRLTSSSSA